MAPLRKALPPDDDMQLMPSLLFSKFGSRCTGHEAWVAYRQGAFPVPVSAAGLASPLPGIPIVRVDLNGAREICHSTCSPMHMLQFGGAFTSI